MGVVYADRNEGGPKVRKCRGRGKWERGGEIAKWNFAIYVTSYMSKRIADDLFFCVAVRRVWPNAAGRDKNEPTRERSRL